jgi:energy-coupling factor transporter ATP-binding protein EcfA2
MIVEGVKVEAFRCFVRATEIRGFTAGLNIVSAPNGTGKSTLFEAIRRALIDHHTVQGVEADKMRPWGRSMAPTVSVEFSHGGQRYRVYKRFLDDPSCELSRWEMDAFVAVDRGERADERVRALLSRPTAPKGLAKEAHWGLAQVLWAPQGMIELGPLGPELATRVRDTLAAQVVGARGAEIERLVEERFRQYFTPQTSRLKTGRKAPEVVRRDEELARARAAVDRARERHERTALTQERVGALRVELAAAERKRATHESIARQCEEKLRGYDERERARAEAALRERDAVAQLRAAKAQIDAWCGAKRALEECERAAVDSEIALALARTRADQCRALAKRAAEEEAEAVRAHEFKRAVEERWRAARAAVLARDERARAESVLMALGEAERELAAAIEARGDAVAPSVAVIERARAAQAQIERSTARLEALSISAEVVAARSVNVVYEGGATAISAGESVVVRGLGAVELVIEGSASLRIKGPIADESVREERERLRLATEEARAIEAQFATADAGQLAERRAALSERDARVREARARVRSLGGDAERARCVRVISESEAVIAAAGPEDPGLEREHEEAVERAASAGDARAKSNARREAERALADAESSLAVMTERAAQRARELERAKQALAVLSREAPSERECSEAYERAALSLDAARAALAKADRASQGRAEVERECSEARAKLARAEADALALRDALRTEEGRLDELSSGAAFSALAKAEEEVARIEAESSRLHLEADAVKLLRETLVRCRDEAVAKVSGEVERAAERILSRIAATDHVRVELGETFAPSRARVGEGEGVELEWLSGGEREQVHFAVRLALAEVLAQEERPMVVLDDVLVATDKARLERVISVLEEAAERMQVVVLTCHPERYESAKSATRIELRSSG